jgi:hypothetical protein
MCLSVLTVRGLVQPTTTTSRKNSLFVLSKAFSASKTQISRRGKTVFPAGKCVFRGPEFDFPGQEFRLPGSELPIPGRETAFPRAELVFPEGDCGVSGQDIADSAQKFVVSEAGYGHKNAQT